MGKSGLFSKAVLSHNLRQPVELRLCRHNGSSAEALKQSLSVMWRNWACHVARAKGGLRYKAVRGSWSSKAGQGCATPTNRVRHPETGKDLLLDVSLSLFHSFLSMMSFQ